VESNVTISTLYIMRAISGTQKLNQTKLKPGLWAFRAIWPGNRSGLFYRSWSPHEPILMKVITYSTHPHMVLAINSNCLNNTAFNRQHRNDCSLKLLGVWSSGMNTWPGFLVKYVQKLITRVDTSVNLWLVTISTSQTQ